MKLRASARAKSIALIKQLFVFCLLFWQLRARSVMTCGMKKKPFTKAPPTTEPRCLVKSNFKVVATD